MTPWLVDAELTTAEQIAENRAWFVSLAPLVAERTKKLADIPPMVRFLFEEPTIEDGAVDKVLKKEGAVAALEKAAAALAGTEWNAAAIEEAVRAVPDAVGVKPKIAFQAVRVAVTGSAVSLPLFESLELLGKERSLARMSAAIEVAG